MARQRFSALLAAAAIFAAPGIFTDGSARGREEVELRECSDASPPRGDFEGCGIEAINCFRIDGFPRFSFDRGVQEDKFGEFEIENCLPGAGTKTKRIRVPAGWNDTEHFRGPVAGAGDWEWLKRELRIVVGFSEAHNFGPEWWEEDIKVNPCRIRHVWVGVRWVQARNAVADHEWFMVYRASRGVENVDPEWAMQCTYTGFDMDLGSDTYAHYYANSAGRAQSRIIANVLQDEFRDAGREDYCPEDCEEEREGEGEEGGGGGDPPGDPPGGDPPPEPPPGEEPGIIT